MHLPFARLLLYRNNDTLLRRFVLKQGAEGTIVIGRKGFGATIELDNPYISRKHAQIEILANGTLWVRDLNSAGGTYVNGQIITLHELKHTDSVEFGSDGNGYRIVLEMVLVETNNALSDDSAPRPNDLPSAHLASDLVMTDYQNADLASLVASKGHIIIGRAEDCDIRLPQLTITRYHASITLENGQYVLRDLDSKNGVFVNGIRIKEPTILTDKDDINIGAYRFRLRKPVEDIRKQKAIVAEGLIRTVNNGQTAILREVSFKIPAQELVAVMGPSGCGKSTLLKALNGDVPATSGRVLIHGIDLYANYDYLKRLIGYVPQDDIVHKELTVEQSLFYAAKLRLSGDVSDEDIRKKIDAVLANLNIADAELRHRRVGELSGGQRKRISIAVELLTDPSVLFLDEPTSPLDPETIEEFLLCLQSLARKGTTIVMVTHKPDDLYYVNRVLFLAKGGFLTYFGDKNNYLSFFNAKNVIEVYAKNRTLEQGAMWAEKFNGSIGESGVIHRANPEISKQRNENVLKQWWWLTARYFHIKLSDRTNTLFMLLQAPIIAGLLALIFKEVELSVLFFMTISAIWFGTNNSAKEIVGELPIYRRERMINLRVGPYLFSKIAVLTLFSVVQALLFVGIVHFFIGTESLAMQNFWPMTFWMAYLAFSATLMGLFLSSQMNNTEKVMTVIPVVLIPQIILAGVITTIPEKSVVEVASYGMYSRWGTQGFTFIQDSIRSYSIVNPAKPDSLAYKTVYGPDFLNLPNTPGFSETLQTNFVAITILNILFFAGMWWAMRKKDSL